jgi:hypothetical protein
LDHAFAAEHAQAAHNLLRRTERLGRIIRDVDRRAAVRGYNLSDQGERPDPGIVDAQVRPATRSKLMRTQSAEWAWRPAIALTLRASPNSRRLAAGSIPCRRRTIISSPASTGGAEWGRKPVQSAPRVEAGCLIKKVRLQDQADVVEAELAQPGLFVRLQGQRANMVELLAQFIEIDLV